MKHLAIAILVLAASCTHDKKGTSTYGQGFDTTRTIVLYVHSPIDNAYKITSAVRFSRDTVLPDPNDKTKNIPQRDTVYNVFIMEKVLDSLGQPIKAAGGRDSMTPANLRWQTVGKGAIIKDFNYNFLPAYNNQVKQLQEQFKK